MKFTFRAASEGTLPRLRALIVDQDAMPADLEPQVVEGARAARFSGKSGQVFETFVDRGGTLVRLALAGAGPAAAADRVAALEKAGRGACRPVPHLG